MSLRLARRVRENYLRGHCRHAGPRRRRPVDRAFPGRPALHGRRHARGLLQRSCSLRSRATRRGGSCTGRRATRSASSSRRAGSGSGGHRVSCLSGLARGRAAWACPGGARAGVWSGALPRVAPDRLAVRAGRTDCHVLWHGRAAARLDGHSPHHTAPSTLAIDHHRDVSRRRTRDTAAASPGARSAGASVNGVSGRDVRVQGMCAGVTARWIPAGKCTRARGTHARGAAPMPRTPGASAIATHGSPSW